MSTTIHDIAAKRTAAVNHFSPRRVLLCLLPLLALALWILAFAGLASAGGTATASSPAQISVQIPETVRDASVVMLDMSINVTRQPQAGHLGAVVRLRRPGGSMAEIGRVSIGGTAGSYQFNIGTMPAGGPAEIEVQLIDRGGGPAPSGAELTIGRVTVVTR